jgi:two-component system phosphate regulon sensor histidine kinase PhoR
MTVLLGRVFRRFQFLWGKRPAITRAFLCWLVGIGVLWMEKDDNFDGRFRARGSIINQEDITLILIGEDEWNLLKNRNQATLRPQKELDTLNDSFFSDPEAWSKVLERILRFEPAVVGITFFIGEGPVTSQPHPILNDPRVLWSGRVNDESRLQRPRMYAVQEKNFGILDLKIDSDGFFRRHIKPNNQHPSLPTLISNTFLNRQADESNLLVNFRGPAGSFLSFSLSELLYGTLPEPAIHGRVILIGARGSSNHAVLTPYGPMTKVEAIANTTANMIYNQHIKTLPIIVYIAILFALVVLSILIITRYSQTVALAMFILLWISYASTSAWAFDSLNIWIPLVAPSVQLLITFIVFISFQLLLNEQETWRLQQEKRYLKEIEELKSNFLSLVSHDLKTPIAKIQAVADRLLTTESKPEIVEDAKIVKRSSQELFRYIQSLLQVTRVESTHFEIRKSPVDVNELIQKAVEDLKPIAKEKQISLTENLEPLFSVEIDKTLIYEVILNLVENAIKYSPNKGSVTISSKEINDEVIVLIKDTGEGVPVDEQSRVWDKFYRGRKHDTTTKGSGLGLYLSKYFIQLHGGRVFLNSEPGNGTEVGFALPLSQTEDEENI